MRVGIIGTGWVAGVHIEALGKLAGVTIAAIAGRNGPRARELAAPIGAAVHDDYRTMLAKEKLDAAFILLPPHVHGDVEIDCCRHVAGVLIEKPVCNDLATAGKIAEAFDKAGTVVSVAYMNRYRASLQRARAIFAQSSDKPVIASGWWVSQMPPPLWWRTITESGGQFVEQCTHVVDAARWIVGEITEVYAAATRGFITGAPGYTVDDAMAVTVRFASGAVGSFVTGCYPLNGTDADRPVGLTISSRTTNCSFAGWDMSLEVNHGKDHPREIVAPEPNIFEIQDRCFIDAVSTRDASLIRSSYADGIASLRVGLAANESARTGRAVRV